jgi:hypothetical protein
MDALRYHLRRSNGRLYWEQFHARVEAESSAKELARIGESYTIEEADDSSPQCFPFKR